MTKDKIVFDIETSNSPDDIGGWGNLHKLNVSVIGAYSYNRNKYQVFDEKELDKFGDLIKQAGLIIGFSSKHFDVPVLAKYYNFNLNAIPHFDILEEIEKSFGRRIGLGILAQANIGMGKTGHGLEAIEMYRRGEMEKLKAYCLQDVKITKEIFDLIRNQGYLWIPQRDIPQMTKVDIAFQDLEPSPQAQLI